MSEVDLSWVEHVAVITLTAPERRNALTAAMARELIATCDGLDAGERAAAVVLQGAAGHFCAGADLALLARVAQDPVDDERYAELDMIYQAFARVAELCSPTIAAVRGVAVGAGVNLALTTDLRIVSRDARLRAGFLGLRLHPGGGHFTLAVRRSGAEAAAAMAIFGQELSGQRAWELGLAWEVVEDDAVERRALEVAKAVGSDVRLARVAVKSLRTEAAAGSLPLAVAVEYERANQLWSLRRSPPTAP